MNWKNSSPNYFHTLNWSRSGPRRHMKKIILAFVHFENFTHSQNQQLQSMRCENKFDWIIKFKVIPTEKCVYLAWRHDDIYGRFMFYRNRDFTIPIILIIRMSDFSFWAEPHQNIPKVTKHWLKYLWTPTPKHRIIFIYLSELITFPFPWEYCQLNTWKR